MARLLILSEPQLVSEAMFYPNITGPKCLKRGIPLIRMFYSIGNLEVHLKLSRGALVDLEVFDTI